MITIDQAYANNGSPQHWYWSISRKQAVWCTETTYKEAESALYGPYESAEAAREANS